MPNPETKSGRLGTNEMTGNELVSKVGLPSKWLVLLAIGVGSIMSTLDSSVANIILPVVSRDLHSDVAAVEWVVTIYLLVVSGLLLSFGRLGDLRGHKRIYLTGFAVFLTGSVLCGFAPNAALLVVFRAIQAVGAAMLYSNSPAILTKNFPSTQRGQALGIQATMTYLGLTLGPSLGGWLTHQFSWHAVFFVNIPIGLVGYLLSLRFIPNDEPEHVTERFDAPGALTFTAGLVSLLLALNQGHAWGWNSVPVLGALGLALILLVAFVKIELRAAYPMLDLRLFGNRLFSAATISAMINYIGIYGVLFLLPFYLIQGRGLDPAQAGLILTAQPLVMVIAAPISGTLSDRVGSRILSTVGMIFLFLGIFFLSQLKPDATITSVALMLALVGLGTGIFISPNTSALLGSAPRHRQGIASGILATARNVGMVLGVGLAGAIFMTLGGSGQSADLSNLTSAIDAGFLASAGVVALGIVTSAIRGG